MWFLEQLQALHHQPDDEANVKEGREEKYKEYGSLVMSLIWETPIPGIYPA
jgi:hypothetical protein